MESMKSNLETHAMEEISLRVAVIGAGVSGLVTARELLREGHRVVIYEKSNQLGGTWVYDPRVDSDPLGVDPKRETVHSSLYASLRTNLPRHLMSLSDYPFTDRVYGDPRNFPGHEEVLRFVSDFAREFGLTGLIRFETEVVRVERVDSGGDGNWVVESRTSGASVMEEFQAVVVCTGHYAEPKVANLPGIEKWPGKQLHSHNYRVPKPFQNQVVVIIGSGASAIDIFREIASVAKQVHLSSRSPNVKFPSFSNTCQHSEIYHVYEDGAIEFQDGSRVYADVILHCTGYKYSFPFLRTNGIVRVDDNRVGPLYKHVFPPRLSPRLSFVGIHYKSIIIATIELQSKWIARVLSGKAILPSEKEMLADVEGHYRNMLDRGVPKHHTHAIHPHEFKYLDVIADLAGVPRVDRRIEKIHEHVFGFLISSGLDMRQFRDEWNPNDIKYGRIGKTCDILQAKL